MKRRRCLPSRSSISAEIKDFRARQEFASLCGFDKLNNSMSTGMGVSNQYAEPYFAFEDDVHAYGVPYFAYESDALRRRIKTKNVIDTSGGSSGKTGDADAAIGLYSHLLNFIFEYRRHFQYAKDLY